MVSFKVVNEGRRSGAYTNKLKRQGLTPGIPDAFIGYPVAPYHGCFIEFKSHGREPTPLQYQSIKRFSEQKYYCIWSDSLDVIWKEFERYLRGTNV